MDRLPHGYTNLTKHLGGGEIEKRYQGPARWANARRELACLTSLEGHLPVPVVLESDLSVPMIVTGALGGRHGQELIDEGHGDQVLHLVGITLRRLQALDPLTVPSLNGSGTVIVHGDFGPQNMHFNVAADAVVGVFDWESAHLGKPVEDLAWAEWIVRTHHPGAVSALTKLHRASGLNLPWAERHQAMVRQCRRNLAYCESSEMTQSAADWRRLLAQTEAWRGP